MVSPPFEGVDTITFSKKPLKRKKTVNFVNDEDLVNITEFTTDDEKKDIRMGVPVYDHDTSPTSVHSVAISDILSDDTMEETEIDELISDDENHPFDEQSEGEIDGCSMEDDMSADEATGAIDKSGSIVKEEEEEGTSPGTNEKFNVDEVDDANAETTYRKHSPGGTFTIRKFDTIEEESSSLEQIENWTLDKLDTCVQWSCGLPPISPQLPHSSLSPTISTDLDVLTPCVTSGSESISGVETVPEYALVSSLGERPLSSLSLSSPELLSAISYMKISPKNYSLESSEEPETSTSSLSDEETKFSNMNIFKRIGDLWNTCHDDDKDTETSQSNEQSSAADTSTPSHLSYGTYPSSSDTYSSDPVISDMSEVPLTMSCPELQIVRDDAAVSDTPSENSPISLPDSLDLILSGMMIISKNGNTLDKFEQTPLSTSETKEEEEDDISDEGSTTTLSGEIGEESISNDSSSATGATSSELSDLIDLSADASEKKDVLVDELWDENEVENVKEITRPHPSEDNIAVALYKALVYKIASRSVIAEVEDEVDDQMPPPAVVCEEEWWDARSHSTTEGKTPEDEALTESSTDSILLSPEKIKLFIEACSPTINEDVLQGMEDEVEIEEMSPASSTESELNLGSIQLIDLCDSLEDEVNKLVDGVSCCKEGSEADAIPVCKQDTIATTSEESSAGVEDTGSSITSLDKDSPLTISRAVRDFEAAILGMFEDDNSTDTNTSCTSGFGSGTGSSLCSETASEVEGTERFVPRIEEVFIVTLEHRDGLPDDYFVETPGSSEEYRKNRLQVLPVTPPPTPPPPPPPQAVVYSPINSDVSDVDEAPFPDYEDYFKPSSPPPSSDVTPEDYDASPLEPETAEPSAPPDEEDHEKYEPGLVQLAVELVDEIFDKLSTTVAECFSDSDKIETPEADSFEDCIPPTDDEGVDYKDCADDSITRLKQALREKESKFINSLSGDWYNPEDSRETLKMDPWARELLNDDEFAYIRKVLENWGRYDVQFD